MWAFTTQANLILRVARLSRRGPWEMKWLPVWIAASLLWWWWGGGGTGLFVQPWEQRVLGLFASQMMIEQLMNTCREERQFLKCILFYVLCLLLLWHICRPYLVVESNEFEGLHPKLDVWLVIGENLNRFVHIAAERIKTHLIYLWAGDWTFTIVTVLH